MESNFDYIVIGAGSAGCVMSNRLSEGGKDTVLSIEAGGKDRNFFIHMPSGYSQIVPKKSSLNYGFETEPEPTTNNRPLYWPRGKVWGGSSSINAMVYIRGHAYDYDLWRQLGNSGWSYDDVLPYFKKAENFQGDGDEDYHGFDGPLNVKKSSRTDDPLLDIFLEAGSQAGFPLTDDFNGKEQEGFSRYEHTMKDTSFGPRRWSSARAYLHPALKRKNLSTETNVQVNKILFEGRKAVGVEYYKNGQVLNCKCNKEIIISATRNGGRAMREPKLGTLEIGAPADLILVNLQSLPFVPLNNLLRQLVYCELGNSVYFTMVAGKIVSTDQRLSTVNEHEVLLEASEIFEHKKELIMSANLQADKLLPYYKKMYQLADEYSLDVNRKF